MRRTGVLTAVASFVTVISIVPATAQTPAGTAAERRAQGAGEPTAQTRLSEPAVLVAPSWPLTNMILEYQTELGLSSEQVEKLERLDGAFIREAIRRQADLDIARLDLVELLEPDEADPAKPVDPARAEAKIRDLERLNADLAVALVRTTEAGKAELTADQRSTLSSLLTGDDPPGRSGSSAHRGSRGAPSHPSGHRGHRGERHHGFHSRFFFGPSVYWGPYWPSPWYTYEPPAVVVEPPPVYIQQAPTPSYWYYCLSARAYYPNVQTCDQPWILVPAQ